MFCQNRLEVLNTPLANLLVEVRVSQLVGPAEYMNKCVGPSKTSLKLQVFLRVPTSLSPHAIGIIANQMGFSLPPVDSSTSSSSTSSLSASAMDMMSRTFLLRVQKSRKTSQARMSASIGQQRAAAGEPWGLAWLQSFLFSLWLFCLFSTHSWIDCRPNSFEDISDGYYKFFLTIPVFKAGLSLTCFNECMGWILRWTGFLFTHCLPRRCMKWLIDLFLHFNILLKNFSFSVWIAPLITGFCWPSLPKPA